MTSIIEVLRTPEYLECITSIDIRGITNTIDDFGIPKIYRYSIEFYIPNAIYRNAKYCYSITETLTYLPSKLFDRTVMQSMLELSKITLTEVHTFAIYEPVDSTQFVDKKVTLIDCTNITHYRD